MSNTQILSNDIDTQILSAYISISIQGWSSKLLQHKDTPFCYDDTKFQTSTLKRWEVIRSEVHPGNGHISKTSMFTNTKFQPFRLPFLIRPLNSNSLDFHIHETVENWVGFNRGKGVSWGVFKGCFGTLPIVGKIKFLYQRTSKEILGTHSQNSHGDFPENAVSSKE